MHLNPSIRVAAIACLFSMFCAAPSSKELWNRVQSSLSERELLAQGHHATFHVRVQIRTWVSQFLLFILSPLSSTGVAV